MHKMHNKASNVKTIGSKYQLILNAKLTKDNSKCYTKAEAQNKLPKLCHIQIMTLLLRGCIQF